MNKELTLSTLLADLAKEHVDFVAAEDPETLNDQDPDAAVAALTAGEKAAGVYFQIGQRTSGAYEIVLLGDGGGYNADPATVAATVDRSGRVWLRGGSALDAVLDASALW